MDWAGLYILYHRKWLVLASQIVSAWQNQLIEEAKIQEMVSNVQSAHEDNCVMAELAMQERVCKQHG